MEVHRRRDQLGGAVGAEGVEEAFQGGAGHALPGPDDRAVAVVVGDHGQVAVTLTVGDLIDPDAVQALQAGIVQVLSHHAHRDGGHRLPGAAQQSGDGGLVGALGQVGHDIFEVAGEPGTRTGPGHGLGADPLAVPAGQPADLGLQVQPRGAEVQVPPAASSPVINRSGRPATRTAQPATSAAQGDHDPAGAELDPGHVGAGDGEHLVECGRGAHASAPPVRLRLAWHLRNLRRTARARPAHQPMRPGSLTAQANDASSARQPTPQKPEESPLLQVASDR
jgi:hypothetical protein